MSYKSTEAVRRWRERNPAKAKERNRRAHLKRRYGITLEEYEALHEQQQGVCAVCPAEATDVDHCLITGEIRGLLCHRCNWALGILNDDSDLLARASDYLRR